VAATSAFVGAAHQLQRRFNVPPSLGLFGLALLFQCASLLSGLDDGLIAVSIQQLPRVVVNVDFLHSHGVMLLFSERSHRAGEWYTLTLETVSRFPNLHLAGRAGKGSRSIFGQIIF
jgi:hypothetical protein